MTWLIEVSDYSIHTLQWFNQVPVDIVKFLLFVQYRFFYLKQLSKQVFHCRTQDAEFSSQETQLSTEKLWLVIHLRNNH